MPPLGSVSSLTLPITSKPVSLGRLYCIILHCIVLHCIVLHYIVLHCTTLHCIAVQCIVSHCITFIILYCSALYCIVRYCTVLYHIVLCCIVLYFIVDHCCADSLTRHHICIKHENAESRALSGLKLKQDIVYSYFPRKLFGVHDDNYWLGMPTPCWWFAPLCLWKKHQIKRNLWCLHDSVMTWKYFQTVGFPLQFSKLNILLHSQNNDVLWPNVSKME